MELTLNIDQAALLMEAIELAQNQCGDGDKNEYQEYETMYQELKKFVNPFDY